MKTEEMILAVPGWSMDMSVFEGLFSQTPAWHGVDLSGCETVEAYANAVAQALFACSGQTVMIGWSLGAMLALEMAANYPDKISALVLVAGTARFTLAPDYDHGVAGAVLQRMKGHLRDSPREVIRAFDRSMFSKEERAIRESWQRESSYSKAALQAGLDYLAARDLRPLLPFVRCRVLLVHGEDDSIIPSSAGDYLYQHLENASSVSRHVCKGAGHHLLQTRPEEVLQVVKEFL